MDCGIEQRPRFGTCQQCGHLFNPQPVAVLEPNGEVLWKLRAAVFCPPPGRPKRKPGERQLKPKPVSCAQLWERHHKWPMDGRAWEMFRKARNDEWDAPRKAGDQAAA